MPQNHTLTQTLAVDVGHVRERGKVWIIGGWPVLLHRLWTFRPVDLLIVPQQRPERVAFIVERQRMTGTGYFAVHETIRHRERPQPVVDAAGNLFDGAAIGAHGVPHPHEMDRIDGRRGMRALPGNSPDRARQPDQSIPHHPQRSDQAACDVESSAIPAIGIGRVSRQLRFAPGITDEPLASDEPGNDTHGERAAAEAEPEDAVTGSVGTGRELVDIENIALQSEAEDAAKNGQRFEQRRADFIVVIRNLLVRVG